MECDRGNTRSIADGGLLLAVLVLSFAKWSAVSGRIQIQLRFSSSKVKPGDGELAILADLGRLDNLDLSGAPITNAGLEHLEHLTSLGFLNLSNTAVSDDGLRHLETLPRLRYLLLYGTRVSDEGVKRFHRASPKVKVGR